MIELIPDIVLSILNVIGFILLAIVPSVIIMLVLAVVIFALLEGSDSRYTIIFIFLCVGGMGLTLISFTLLAHWVFLS